MMGVRQRLMRFTLPTCGKLFGFGGTHLPCLVHSMPCHRPEHPCRQQLPFDLKAFCLPNSRAFINPSSPSRSSRPPRVTLSSSRLLPTVQPWRQSRNVLTPAQPLAPLLGSTPHPTRSLPRDPVEEILPSTARTARVHRVVHITSPMFDRQGSSTPPAVPAVCDGAR